MKRKSPKITLDELRAAQDEVFDWNALKKDVKEHFAKMTASNGSIIPKNKS